MNDRLTTAAEAYFTDLARVRASGGATGVAKVVRALCHLRDAAATRERAEIGRELALAFFRKHLHRMRYHALKEVGIAIGSGVVEAANRPW